MRGSVQGPCSRAPLAGPPPEGSRVRDSSRAFDELAGEHALEMRFRRGARDSTHTALHYSTLHFTALHWHERSIYFSLSTSLLHTVAITLLLSLSAPGSFSHSLTLPQSLYTTASVLPVQLDQEVLQTEQNMHRIHSVHRSIQQYKDQIQKTSGETSK